MIVGIPSLVGHATYNYKYQCRSS